MSTCDEKNIDAQIKEETSYSLINRGIFLEEQKGCCREQKEQVTYYA